MTQYFKTNWISDDGLSIFAQGWEPDKEPLAVVCLVHGLGEHSGRYEHVAMFLNENGYAVLTFDLRGHGLSEGQRGHTPSFDAYFDDIDILLQKTADRYPDKPVFLYGHSLGSTLVLCYALKRRPDLAGVVASAAVLHTELEEHTLKVNLSKVLGSIYPTLSMPSGLDPNSISSDPEVVKTYVNDPLVHDRVTTGFAKSALSANAWAIEHAQEFSLPLLMMHGSSDKIGYPSGSKEFAGLVQCECELKIWEDLFHEIHNEPQNEQVLAYLVEWMNKILSGDQDRHTGGEK